MNLLTKYLNILIVEDHDEEYNLLLDCIQNSGVLTEHIVHAKTVAKTKDFLLGEMKLDLVVLRTSITGPVSGTGRDLPNRYVADRGDVRLAQLAALGQCPHPGGAG